MSRNSTLERMEKEAAELEERIARLTTRNEEYWTLTDRLEDLCSKIDLIYAEYEEREMGVSHESR